MRLRTVLWILAAAAFGRARAQADEPRALAIVRELDGAPRERRADILQRACAAVRREARALREATAAELFQAAVALSEQPDAVAAGCSADDLYAIAIDAAHASGNEEGEASVAYRLALAARDRGEPDRARAALERCDALEVPQMRPWLELELAQLARLRGDWSTAFHRLDRARDALRDGDDYHLLAASHVRGESAQCLLELGVTDAAARSIDVLIAAEGALRAKGLLDVTTWLAARLYRLNLLLAQEDFEGCEAEAEAALADPTFGAELGALADLVRYRRDVARVIRARDGARETSAALDALQSVCEAKSLGRVERARAHFEIARSRIRAREFAAAEHALAAAEELVRAPTGGASGPDAPRLWSIRGELALARGLGARELEPVLAGLQAAWESFLSEWSHVPPRAGGIGFLHFGGRRAVLSELTRLLIAVHGADGAALAFEEWLRAQAQGSVARALDATPGTLAELRAELWHGDAHGILVYLAAPDRTHLFALDGRSLRIYELARRRDLQLARDTLLPFLAAPLSQSERVAFRAAARAAARAFFPAELHDWLAEHRCLTVVGADQFGFVPFEVFASPLDGASAPSLGITHALDHLPSLPVGLALARRAAARTPLEPASIVLVADVDASALVTGRWPELAPLRASAADLACLTESVDAARATILRGPAASWERVVASMSARPRLLQFLTHGVLDPERERPAGLVLTPGSAERPGIVWCDDVERAPTADVVVLASCATARGPLRRGDDGGQNLGGAFLRAGASCVVLSPLEIEYRDAVRASATFQRALLRDGSSPAESLRAARAALAAEAESADPCHWAPLQLVGLGQRPLRATAPRARDSSAWLAVAAAAVFVAAAGVWRARRAR